MKTRNTLSVLSTMLFVAALFCSCNPDLQVSDVQYYYLLNNNYLLTNNRCTFIGDTMTEYAIWQESGSKYTFRIEDYVPFDYFIDDNGNTYEFGQHIISQYDSAVHKHTKRLYEPYIEINGEKKIIPIEGEAKYIVPGEKDVYFIIQELYETGELDRFGNKMYGYNYLAFSEGKQPEKIGSQSLSEIGGKLATIKNIKIIDDDFYIVGRRENYPIFCSFKDIATPYILSLNLGATYDLMKVDTTILVCGNDANHACIWSISGSNIEQAMLPPADENLPSNACSIDKVGNDIYIGGRIGTKPAIWKNGEVFAIYEEFPPHQNPYYLYDRPDVRFTYQSGCIQALRVYGNKAYSIVVTENTPNSVGYIDNKLMAVEWDFSKDPVTCQYRYDLVEMLRDGSIYLYESFYHDNLYTQWVPGLIEPYEIYWDKLEYTHPRIALQYVKDK